MADYDFSKPAPDRSHRVPKSTGTGMGGIGFALIGSVIVLVVLFAVFGGAGVPTTSDAPVGVDSAAPEPAPLVVPTE